MPVEEAMAPVQEEVVMVEPEVKVDKEGKEEFFVIRKEEAVVVRQEEFEVIHQDDVPFDFDAEIENPNLAIIAGEGSYLISSGYSHNDSVHEERPMKLQEKMSGWSMHPMCTLPKWIDAEKDFVEAEGGEQVRTGEEEDDLDNDDKEKGIHTDDILERFAPDLVYIPDSAKW